jgi:hypothetical protein
LLPHVSLDQHMHYILITKSITPTYVSAYNRPSSRGQSFLHRLYICCSFFFKKVSTST